MQLNRYHALIGTGILILFAALLTLFVGCGEPSFVAPSPAPEVLRPGDDDYTCQVDAAAQCTNCDGSEPGCSYTYTCTNGTGGCVNVQTILCRKCLLGGDTDE